MALKILAKSQVSISSVIVNSSAVVNNAYIVQIRKIKYIILFQFTDGKQGKRTFVEISKIIQMAAILLGNHIPNLKRSHNFESTSKQLHINFENLS